MIEKSLQRRSSVSQILPTFFAVIIHSNTSSGSNFTKLFSLEAPLKSSVAPSWVLLSTLFLIFKQELSLIKLSLIPMSGVSGPDKVLSLGWVVSRDTEGGGWVITPLGVSDVSRDTDGGGWVITPLGVSDVSRDTDGGGWVITPLGVSDVSRDTDGGG